MLAVVGDLVEDIVVRLGTAPAIGTDTPARIDRRRGGSAANVAAIAASIDVPVRFIGRVGDDALGDQLAQDLASGGVDVRVQRVGRTGTIVVLVDESTGERTMLPDRAAAAELADVDPGWLDGISWLHVPAYSLLAEPIGSTSLELIRFLRRTGGGVSIDASSVAVIEAFGVSGFVAILDLIEPDLVFANEPESALVPVDRPWLTVVKQGAGPVIVHRPGDPALRVPVEPIADVEDTTGAGDAFAAAFLAATTRGESPADAAAAGIRVAGAMLAERSA